MFAIPYIIRAMKPLRFILFLCALIAFSGSAARAAALVMVEQAGCDWCEKWDEEIGVIYDRTPEGHVAPLRRIDIYEPLPADLAFIGGLVFTPTFVLVDAGREIGRINGYPGEDFFWGLLHRLLEKLPSVSPVKRFDPDALRRTDNTGHRNSTKG